MAEKHRKTCYSPIAAKPKSFIKHRPVKTMASPYLEWTDENQQTHRIDITDRLCIGRTCTGLDTRRRFLLNNPRVSRDHAEIKWTAGRLHITDNSSNGTWVNNSRMTAGATKDLADGDHIRIGRSLMRIGYPEAGNGSGPPPGLTEMTSVASLEEEVTSLVTDMRGFSAYSQNHASSEVYGLMREVFDQFSEIIEAFKGTVKDYAGDAVFAFWEHQFEDPATQSMRACRAARRQLRSFDRILRELGQQYAGTGKLKMGWGITTGPIFLSHYGSRRADLAMVGDCVNLASRLSGMANKEIGDDILVCASTAALVENQVSLKDLGRVSIRGRQGREHLFALSAD